VAVVEPMPTYSIMVDLVDLVPLESLMYGAVAAVAIIIKINITAMVLRDTVA
jgi:hypothetical protein